MYLSVTSLILPLASLVALVATMPQVTTSITHHGPLKSPSVRHRDDMPAPEIDVMHATRNPLGRDRLAKPRVGRQHSNTKDVLR